MFELRGKLKVLFDTQTFASGFSKREFVVTTPDDRYPQDIKFEVVKDKISQLDSVQVGQDVAVSFDLRGNEYNGKYYVNLNAWRIQAAQGGATSAQSTPQQQAATPAQSASPASSGPAFEAEPSSTDLNGSFDDEDIPF